MNKIISDIGDDGGDATGFLLNAVEEGVLEDRINLVEDEIGPIEVVLFNLGAQLVTVHSMIQVLKHSN